MKQRGAASIGEQLAAQSDQSARRNFKVHAHTAGAVIVHLQHFAAPGAQGFQNDANEVFRNIHDQAFDRLELFATFVANDDLGLADHQLKTFAAHGLNQNGQLQFAAAEYPERFRRVGILHANGNVGQQFALQAIAQIA